MVDRMTAAQLQAFYRTDGQIGPTDGPEAPTRHRRDIEGPLHKAVARLCKLVLPREAVLHHSPNELDMAGSDAARVVAKARDMGTVKGWPDFEIMCGGAAFFLEIKAPAGRVQETQTDTHLRLAAAGCKVAIVRSVEEAHEQLKKWGLA
jgi:hypothetical protein